MTESRSCSNCERREGIMCSDSWWPCEIERGNPTVCGIDFDRWKPRRGVAIRFKQFLFGVEQKEKNNE